MAKITFIQLLNKYRQDSFSERDKGHRFERMMQAYLLTDPKYAYQLKNVWLWNEFPCKDELGGIDSGIDLVAKTTNDEYWAIQCKCYQENSVIDKPAVDSFLSTSSRKFTAENGSKTGFSLRLWISTSNKWGPNATEAIKNQHPQVQRVNLVELIEAGVDWEKLDKGISGELARTPKKELRQHQKDALNKTHEHFKKHDRGKLIMACGTGKTFNALRIAENETQGKGLILFLVPSISLLGQSLREWSSDAKEPINAVCICSDPEISKKKSKNEDNDTFSVVDLALPASTNVKEIVSQFKKFKNANGMTVVFSTYQSIDVIAKAQKELAKEKAQYSQFDLIICDEAHRTTGVTLSGEDESAFTKVHDNKFIASKKRLYMTATPRLYNDDTKSKAAQAEAILCSMDDVTLYGEEIYRIGFGEAVEKDLLTDYKVLILTLNENDIPPAVQDIITNKQSEINTDDASKLIGCINALSKQILGDQGIIKDSDPEPMRRAVAFCQSIAVSKKITSTFNTATDAYLSSLPEEQQGKMVSVASKHIDGTMSAPDRDMLLYWLKEPAEDNECKILTNVRCLSEGVDVPSLDAVMFLSARNSQVDVVQSVGRVMRKSPGKKYGYIIIPVVVPASIEADRALDDNERYKVVWTVLNALRAHDDRFNATVNKIELNKKRPDQILIGRPEYSFENGMPVFAEPGVEYKNSEIGRQIALQFEQLQNVVFARMVQKVGDRRYWEQWAKNVAEIAERQCERVTRLVRDDEKHRKAFEKFLKGLQKNINPSISDAEAIDMLCQHIITKPVFEALFEGYSFVQNNPISVSMQSMLDLLEEQAIEKDTETLQKFYDSVKMRAAGIDNAEGKQRIIIELYDKFFKTAFPLMVEKLGIVYTPVEVVDFIIRSVDDILRKDFQRTISDENINILDPYTGTGTFITRLLQSGLINRDDLIRKYKSEIFANELVLLAYYIAAVNIENAFHDILALDKYESFEGICLTDTFQLGETDDGEKLFSDMFPQNSARVQKQKKAPLKVIIGNPPYSAGQKSANDNAQNQSYPKLDKRIADTYASGVDATNINALYNSYIKAFRWSTDRLDKSGGVVCFVTDGGWLENKAMVGFRKHLEKEFSSIYVLNLRGNAHGSGEQRKKEAGNVFGHGSRSSISVTLLIKKEQSQSEKAVINYADIGDYLSKEEKLTKISKLKSVSNAAWNWRVLSPNDHGDWINMRNDHFTALIPIAPEDKFDQSVQSIFTGYSIGIGTSRDPWVYNYSKHTLTESVKRCITFYNGQVKDFQEARKKKPDLEIASFIDKNERNISWSSSLIPAAERGKLDKFDTNRITEAYYRPFNKQFLYFGDLLIHRKGQFKDFFKDGNEKNLLICVSSTPKGLDVLITDSYTDYHFNGDTKCFPLFYFEKKKEGVIELFENSDNDYIKRDGISDFILNLASKKYGSNLSKEDIFYYVYGFLHSVEYRREFDNDLKKMLPRLSLVDDVRDFWKFAKAGRELADLHLNYETFDAPSEISVTGLEKGNFNVEKIRFTKKDQKNTIIFNSDITIFNVPDKAYQYTINGRTPIDWVLERYQISTDLTSKGEGSGIKDDPNLWSQEHNDSKYIFNLLLSVITVSIKTVDIINGLPKIKFNTATKENVAV